MGSERNIKDGPFCWQNKAALRMIAETFAESNQAVSARSLYVGLTELASDEQSETFIASKALIAHKSGLSVKTVERLLPGFEHLGLLRIDRGLVKARSGSIKAPNTYTLLSIRPSDAMSMRHGGKHGSKSDKVEESGRIFEEREKNVARAHVRSKAATANDVFELEEIVRKSGNDSEKLTAALQSHFPTVDLKWEVSNYRDWMKRHCKRPTPRGFVRWLARIEPTLRPLACKTGSNGAPKPQPDGWAEWVDKNHPGAIVRNYWRVTGDVQREFREAMAQQPGTMP